VIVRAAVGGAAEERAGERGGLDAQSGGSKVAGVMFRNAAECCLAKARGRCPSFRRAARSSWPVSGRLRDQR
jgi:hypothetical protein